MSCCTVDLRARKGAAPLKQSLAKLRQFRIVQGTMTVAVSLPEDVATLAKSEGGELDHAVAAAIVFYHYERGRLSAGKAAQLLGLDRAEFEQRRMERGIDRPFSPDELSRDVNWARTVFSGSGRA